LTQITIADSKAIFEDAVQDHVLDIVEPTKRYIDKLGKSNKAIKWSDDSIRAWSKVIVAEGVYYLIDDVSSRPDADALTETAVTAAIRSIKGGEKLTDEQRNDLRALIFPFMENLISRIEQVREQTQVPSATAQEFIDEALAKTPTNWSMPDKYAFEAAQEIDESLHPTLALIKASTYIQRLRRLNAKQQARVKKARGLREELKQNPITNAGPRGIRGFLRRLFLASLNGTPFDDLNWIEVNHEGLQIYTPFSTVSQRTIKYAQLMNNAVVLSVDPPAYLDWYLGVARQFRRNIQAPIGEIVVYEPGSGRTLAKAVALWPNAKIKEMRDALEALHLLENPFNGLQRLPRLRDILIYYDFAGSDWEELENLLTADSTHSSPGEP